MIQHPKNFLIVVQQSIRPQLFQKRFQSFLLRLPGLRIEKRILHPVIKNPGRFDVLPLMHALLHLERSIHIYNKLKLQSVIQ